MDREPNKPERMAMYLYSERYATGTLSAIDFFKSLSPWERENCRDAVTGIENAKPENIE